MTEYSRALGECIYQNRKRRKLTQAELAAILAREQPQISLLVNAAGFGKFGDFEGI